MKSTGPRTAPPGHPTDPPLAHALPCGTSACPPLPGFAAGLRLAAVYTPIGAIIGERVGASKGLG